jgi:colanic acid/amylovoran biosynthesis glycosyltransferase
MKIAFIVTHFPVLSETFILDQITGLMDRGHQVDIYASNLHDDPVAHEDVQKYQLLERTHYLDTTAAIPKNKAIRLMGGITRVAANFHRQPLSIIKSLNVLKFGREAASLGVLYRMAPFWSRGPYDIVHCQFGPSGNVALSLEDQGAFRAKVVTTFRGFYTSSYVRVKGRRIYERLFKRGNLFLCVTEGIRRQVIDLGCPEEKTLVHPSGVDNRKFSFVTRGPKTDSCVRLLTIARLVEKKGVEYGIRAVAKILEKYPDIQYSVAGDGPLRNSLEHLIEKVRAGANIKLIGWKRQGEILELLRQADILLAPSVTAEDGDQEGIPGVLREALACGLPVLATRHSGIPDLVEDGVSGFLVPERDANALAERLDYLIRHREIWSEMGKAGRKYVEQHYNIDRLNDRLVALYEQLRNGTIPVNVDSAVSWDLMHRRAAEGAERNQL